MKTVDIGNQNLDGQIIPFPPIILANIGNDKSKKTVCIYGHYDVQPASLEDGWDTPPFELTEKDGKLYGRGSTDDKGPVIGWLLAVQFFQENNIDIPCNLKFCFEGMEESDSEGLESVVKQEANKFFGDVDYFCISDNYWLGTKKPCLTYGIRGISCFEMEIIGTKTDLHSGVYGGSVHEPMTDLIALLSKLVNPNDGKILIPGIYDDVEVLTESEDSLYNDIVFDTDEFKESIGASKLLHESKEEVLKHRWRYPSLSIHGIEGAYSDSGFKTVIPARVIGKFSIRLVPNMTPEKVESLVCSYLNEEFKKLGSGNKFSIKMTSSGKTWKGDPNHPNFIAGRNATLKVWNEEPNFIREGGSIPIVITFEEETGKKVILLPMGCGDDGAHGQNEKINVINYINGIKLFVAYMYEISKL